MNRAEQEWHDMELDRGVLPDDDEPEPCKWCERQECRDSRDCELNLGIAPKD